MTSLDHEQLIELYRCMALARAIDERLWQMNRQGLTHFAVPCAGHEGVGAAYAMALKPGHDFLAPHYRDMSALLAVGQGAVDIMLHALAKSGDPAGAGRQMFAHWGDRKRNIVTLSSPQPNHILHGVGIALASQLRHEDAVTVIAFGDGSSSKGDFHEGLNFAGIYKLPCVFICENNGFSISVPQSKQMAVHDVAIRAQGYGFEGIVVDGCDPVRVYEVSRAAVDKARSGGGPTLIETKVERLLPHTSNDDDTRYRSREELDRIRQQRDPVPLFRKRLLSEGVLSDELLARISAGIAAEVDEAQRSATAAPAPLPADTLKHVYA